MKKEAKMIVATERTIEIGSNIDVRSWCDACGGPTRMLSVEMAAAMACVGSGAIRHWIGNAEFHVEQTQAGLYRICQRSFIDHLKRLDFLPKSRLGGSRRN